MNLVRILFWDCNSKEIDKSDAKRCTIIHALNTDGWEEFAKQYGLEPDNIPSFKPPTNDFLFTWSSGKTIYIAEYYEVEEKTEKVFVYYNPMISDLQSYYASAVKENMERLAQKVPKKLMNVK